ncbi:MAG: response regulator [Myxococcota bacterium]|jgi:PAS domain S-box-containing protein|nr:response regulator [Myxococcota bacterium]
MKQKFIFYFISIALVSMTATASIAILQSRQAARQQHHGNFELLSQALRDDVSRVIGQAHTDVSLVARNVEVVARNEQPLSLELQRLGRIMQGYSDITLIDEKGLVLASTTYDFQGDWRYRRGFREALVHGDAMAGFHLLPATGKLALAFYSRFLFPNGKAAVAALQLDASRLADIPLRVAQQKGLVAFIIDERGRFVAHPQAAYLMEIAWPTLLSQFRGSSGNVDFSMFGTNFLGGYALLRGFALDGETAVPGWAVVVAEEHDRVFGFLRSMLRRVYLIGAVIFGALVLLGLALASRMARPIERLSFAVEKLSKRDFEVSVVREGPTEVAKLGAAFNAMVGELGLYQARLSESEQRYRDLTDLLPQTVFEADDRGRFTYVNRAGLSMFGYKASEVLEDPGIYVLHTLVPEDRARAAGVWRSLLAGVHSQGNHYRALRRDGSTLPILIYSAVYDIKAGRRGLRGIAIDVSELEKKDAIVREAQRLETIALLSGGLAHDLNNVLGGILGAVGLIRHHLRPNAPKLEQVERMLNLVDSSVARASEMIQKLLAMSRRTDLSLRPMDLNQAVEHVVAVCRGSFDKSVEIVTELAVDPAVVRADASQLEQVLLNLVINAYHAVTLMRGEDGKEQGGRVQIALRRVRLKEGEILQGLAPALLSRGGDYWRVSVSDDGVGIPAEVRARVFEPFYTTKPAGKGSGLGLAVIHSIAQQNGALLTLLSSEGQGTTFEFYLPVCKDSIIARKSWPQEPSLTQFSGRVLVVDDDVVLMRTTAMMLETLGYDVETASDGKEALEKFECDADRFDLVLADLSMPRMSGQELLTVLRKAYPTLCLALMTGHVGDKGIKEVEELGIAFVLSKPFDLDALAARVGKVSKKRESLERGA